MSAAVIFVRFTVEGFHCWPTAPAHRAYLGQRHRHQFHVEVRMPVEHDDRAVEFHDVLDKARALFHGGELGGQSCEAMARALATELADAYSRLVTVSVAEDGEVGAMVQV